jgi:tetratricopeptide (TPR) repeat protein
MKNLILMAFAFLAYCNVTFAQKLNKSSSFNKALEQASKEGKTTLLVINPTPFTPPPNFKGVIPNFDIAFDDQEVIEKINENFIVYKTIYSDTTIRKILSKSTINTYPAYIFLHPNQDIYFRDFGHFSGKSRYLTMIDNALKASKEKSITELEKDYLANKNDQALIKKLIDIRKQTGINDNANLIEQYVNGLKIGDFNNYQTVLYILEAGPYADGNAYKLAFTNRKIIDSIYKTEPLQKRSSFNNFMINNTMNAAIKTKNAVKAQSAANFTRGTWSKDYQKGAKAYDQQMMRYYLAIKDTANYIGTAIYHYDSYYMRIGADSIKRIETSESAASKRVLPTGLNPNMISKEKMDSIMKAPGANKLLQSSYTTVGSTSSNYANELNNAAYKFYEIGTKNINHLTKAMIWSRRSLELNPISGYYDTLAHILYRMGYFEEAVKTQQEAIEKSKTEQRNPDRLKDELKKMKARVI